MTPNIARFSSITLEEYFALQQQPNDQHRRVLRKQWAFNALYSSNQQSRILMPTWLVIPPETITTIVNENNHE